MNTERAPIREPMRSPEHAVAAKPERKRKRPRGTDMLHADIDKKPDGMDWNWKRVSVYGQQDRDSQIEDAENGWEPVNGAIFSEHQKGPVERHGMILMERPQELSDEAAAEELAAARNQVSAHKQGLSEPATPTNPRDHVKTKPRLKQTMGPIEAAD